VVLIVFAWSAIMLFSSFWKGLSVPPQFAYSFVSGCLNQLDKALANAPANQKRVVLADLVTHYCAGHTRQDLVYYFQAICHIGNLHEPEITNQQTRDQVLHALITAYRSVLANNHFGLQ
jgi:hypothetical protein